MKIFVWNNLSQKQQAKALSRPAQGSDSGIVRDARLIVQAVKARGDAALREFAVRFDRVDAKDFRISPAAIDAAGTRVDAKLRTAIRQAKTNIERFHKTERSKSIKLRVMPGIACELHWRAIETVGLYVPGGTAPLFSTVLMQAIPAVIAGCERITLCTPPQRGGGVHPAVLYAAQLCGISEIFALGGAQAIAAMAYGTKTIPKADKIFGPGNTYVTAAKQLVSQDSDGAAIDMPAGPSEVMVIADGKARADWVAADLLAQAEYDALSQAMLVTTSVSFAERVMGEVKTQMAQLPRRAIAAKSIAQSRIILVSGMTEAIDVANRYAPEHLILHNADAAKYLPKIRNAGSVFLGALTPESAGDYASGTNHVLPTYGHARAYGGLTVLSFMKSMTAQSLTRAGLRRLGPAIVTMAEAEGLHGHANAVKIRMEG